MGIQPKAKKMVAKPKTKARTTTNSNTMTKRLPWETRMTKLPQTKTKTGPKVMTQVVYVPQGWNNNQLKKGGGKGKSKGTFRKQPAMRGSVGKMVKGKIGKFGKASARKVSNSVSRDKEIDKESRYTGTVVSYHKLKGCGFIKADDSDVVKDNLFVFWKSIKSDDRFPSLQKDMQVEFGLAKKKGMNNKWSLVAKQVSMPGGGNIAVQDEMDSQKEFVGGKDARYTGRLKFFDAMAGFGYVKMAKTVDDGDEKVPQEVRVERAEVDAGGRAPKRMKDMAVEFGIWKTKKGQYRCYNMTAPGGEPLTEQLVDKRKVIEDKTLTGKIVIYSFKGNWGYIVPEGTLPQEAKKKIAQQNKATKEKGKEVKHKDAVYFRRADCEKGFKPAKDASVTFQLYTDEKGVGAYEIQEN